MKACSLGQGSGAICREWLGTTGRGIELRIHLQPMYGFRMKDIPSPCPYVPQQLLGVLTETIFILLQYIPSHS
jgi:hypothetical protein